MTKSRHIARPRCRWTAEMDAELVRRYANEPTAAIAADLGERCERSGAYFGVWNFITKLNLALAAGLALPLLDLLGYRPGDAGGHAALVFAYALLPLGFKLLAATLLWRWRDTLEVRS